MDSTVTIAITKLNNQTLKTSQVSPKKLSYSVTKSSNTMKYDMTRPEYLIIKVDDIKKSLVILADPLESKPPGPTDHGVYNILNAPYKADPKGESYSHKQIQAAIDDAFSHGGGVVYVPAGIYKCGNIVLKDNVEFYLAVQDGHNSSITGRGTIWGDGKNTLDANSQNCFTTLVEPLNTAGFLFDGPIIKEGSYWHFNVMHSRNVQIKNVKVLGRFDMGENDGIDVTKSQSVNVTRAFAAVWDDSFSTKSCNPSAFRGGDPQNAIHGSPQPCKDVIFECVFGWTGLYGLKIGQGFETDQSNIVFRNAVVYDCSTGIGIDHRYGTGALSGANFQNVEIERVSVTVDNRRTWMAFNIEESGQRGVLPAGDVTVKNVTIYDMGTTPAEIGGWNAQVKFGKVSLEQIRITTLPGGRQARSKEELKLTTVKYLAGPVDLTYTKDGPSKTVQLY